MLSPDKVTPQTEAGWEEKEPGEVIDVEKLMAIARRQWRVVAICVGAAIVLGLVYLITAVPIYTAAASVLIDRRNSELVNQFANMGMLQDDEAAVLSEVEVFRSDSIALAVVDKLKLTENPLFMAPSRSLFGTLRSLLSFKSWFASDVLEADRARANAAKAVIDGMSVDRVGRSYVLSISYSSPSPKLAADIAGAIADAYLVDKLNSKYDATRRASDWLQERIAELRQKSLESDLAVQKFRSENGLLQVGSSAGTLLLSDQQLSQLNSALIQAQADTAKAQARYDNVKAIVESGRTDAIVTDVLDSSISNDLRKKYLEASKFEAEISARLGRDHVQAVRARKEMDEYKRLMFDELNRIAESYQSELVVAQTREKSLKDSVDQAMGVSSTAGETQVELRELERSAETYRSLYQTFLTRYQEATQQQSFPITESRIITRAQVPEKPSAPKKPLTMAFALILGLAMGAGIGAFREFRDRFFRTGEQVRDVLALEYLGHIPMITSKERTAGDDQPLSPRALQTSNPMTRYVVDHPLSAFAETMRAAKIAIDLEDPGKPTKIIGVISSLPGEGKSTVSLNFAQLLAMQGARTLLIDADLRNPGATRAVGRHAQEGLLEVILEGKPIQNLLMLDSKTKLAFLPAIVKRRVPHSSDLLASQIMARVLGDLKGHFDYIVLDLPPLGPVVDARAVGPLLDACIAVVEWGRTSRRVVHSTFSAHPELMQKCMGVVLNKVDTQKLKLYHAYGSGEYYYSRYSAYYQEG